MSPNLTRLVAVRAAGQGSGFLLAPRLILTAEHFLGTGRIQAAAPGGTGFVPCSVVWRGSQGTGAQDVALLRARSELVSAAVAEAFDPIHWGWASKSTPLAGCHATGFPRFARGLDRRLESAQAAGTFLPGAAVLAGRYILADTHGVPAVEQDGGSPWAGLSGAALFHQDFLLGVVVADHRPQVHGHTRIEAVPVAGLLSDQEFCGILANHLSETPVLLDVSSDSAYDPRFEREYGQAIRADYGRTRIFGLRQASAQGRRGWELDSAYLSLQATESLQAIERGGTVTGPGSSAQAPPPRRVEAVLHGRRRVLLRGEAGSGKTTLVQWLAVQSMAGTLGTELAGLNHRIPFVLQLRKLFLRGVMRPRPEEFLALDGRLCADRQPDGWAHRVLRAGRGLLLVDGLDEVPEAEREESLSWLEQLLDHYPKTWILATVRPSAVAPDWLAHLSFEEVSLLPMGDADRQLFIERWHRAALAELLADQHSVAEAQRWRTDLRELERDLLRTLETSPELAQLTDSPLLCAMVCALNRESDGVLPHHRMEIYRDALTMLLVKRDEIRRVRGSERVQLSEAEQLAMLRRIAHWLVRNNQAEGRREDAIAQIGKVLPNLRSAAELGDADHAYRHLLNRSGLLAETGVANFQFIHRTFQDYLAAMELQEERDFGLLADRAAEQQWWDVIRLTVGHCGPRDRFDLLSRLLERADRADPEQRSDIQLLAASCLPYAPELDGALRNTILERLREPVRHYLTAGYAPAERLAAVGQDLLPLLRELGPGLVKKSEVARIRIPGVLGSIGGNDALDALAELVMLGDPRLTAEAARKWSRFDEDRFAERVLEPADLDRVQVAARTAGQLTRLTELAGRGRLRMALVAAPMATDSPGLTALAEQVPHLTLSGVAAVRDLAFLRSCTGLEHLGLYYCPDLRDLSALRGSRLPSLAVRAEPEFPFPLLHELVSTMPGLVSLTISAPEVSALRHLPAVTGLRDLLLIDVGEEYPVEQLLDVFPGLSRLTLDLGVDCSVIDVGPLGDREDLRVSVFSGQRRGPLRVIGSERLAEDQLTIDRREVLA